MLVKNFLKKDFKIIVFEKKGTIFFLWNYILELYFGETLLEKDSKIIVPKKKRNYIFFLELSFGGALLKTDSKIIVPEKKGTIFFFLNYFLVKHF